LRKESLLAKVTEAEDVTTTLGRGADQSWRLELLEATVFQV
jgi:hypothetical protein